MKNFSISACCCMLISFIGNAWSQTAWTAAAPLGNSATPRYTACAFSIGTKGYLGTGFFNSHFYNDFFEFDPSANSWTEKSTFAGVARSGATAFSMGTKGYIGLGYDGVNYRDDFWEYDQANDSWSQKANFGGVGRSGAMGFSIGTKAYVGTGLAGTVRKSDFWEYDQPTNAWTPKTDFPGGPRSSAAGFAIGTKGYLGTGYDGNTRKADLYEYNPANNSWTAKKKFAGTPRSNTVSFSIGSKGYIGTGYDNSSFRNDFWEYNPTANAWTQKTDFAGAGRYNATGFSIGTKGYIGTGFDGVSARYDVWEYDQAADSWMQKSGFGGYARSGAISFTINLKGYVGTGYDGYTYKNDLWEYDPLNNSWTQKANFAGVERTGAVGFTINSKGYAGTGFNGSYLKDFWEYNATSNTWTQKTNLPGAARSEAASFVIGSKGYISTGTSGTSINDLWEFDPAANSWLQKAIFPGAARQQATGFSINTKGYVSTGVDDIGNYYDDLWEYNQSSNSWLAKEDFPGDPRRAAVSQTINGKGYVATGYNQSDLNIADVWEYDQAVDDWIRKADFIGNARNSGIFFSISGNGYAGFGDDGSQVKNDLFVFNPANTISLPGNNFCAGSSFSIIFTNANYILPGNVFTAQLSDATGSFNIPVSIGTLNGSAAGAINATIPSNISAGNNYLIRITNSNPAQTIITSNAITINASPVITSCPPNVTASPLLGLCSALVFYNAATASGSPAPVITYSQNSGTTFNAGTNDVVVTASNTCGAATCDFTVTVTDAEFPLIVCPLGINVNATNGQCSASGLNLGTPIALDNCGSPIISNDAPTDFPVGNTTVTWTATDAGDNKSTCTQSVTVIDNQPPSITCPPTVVVNTNTDLCSASNVNLGIPATSDNCGVATLTNNAPSVFPVGNTLVTWVATDVNGKTTNCTQTVTVVDNQLPLIACPANVTVNASANLCTASNVQLNTPAATDNCGIASVTNNAPSTFPVGNTTVTWTATDVNGNIRSCEQTVTVVDNQMPVITCPSNVTVNAALNQCTATNVNLGNPSTSDNCGIASVTNNEPSAFPVGNTIVTWMVTDINGNTASCNQSVTVIDNQNPVFSGCPPNITTCSNPVSWTPPTASDNCGIASITTDHNPGSTFPNGTTLVTYTATDVNGRMATCIFTVTLSAAVYSVTPAGSVNVCKPSTVTLTVSPAGSSYKWFKNNAQISGATTMSYIAKVTGNYLCKVTGSCGTVSSNSVTVTVNAVPPATISPSGTVNFCTGQTVTLTANSGAGFTYQWVKGSVNIAAATNNAYTTGAAGTYKVIVTSNGCSKTSAGTKLVKSCRNQLTEQLTELSVFPNPNGGIFTVMFTKENSKSATLRISDLLGRIVYSAGIPQGEETVHIELPNEAPGIYFIQMISEDNAIVKQFEIIR